MDTTFKRALGAKPATVKDYRSVAYSAVKTAAPFANGVTEFQNDYSMIPVIDQGMEPECEQCAAKAYQSRKIFKESGKLPDISTRAWYQLARMYAADSNGPDGSETFYTDMAALHTGLIGTDLVPEDRTLATSIYGQALDITGPMVADAVSKKIAGVTTPNITLPEITYAVQFDDGILVTIAIDDTWYRYVPGKQELDGTGSPLGLHRVLITGFHVKPDGSFWFHGRNSWGAQWGIGGDFEFNSAVYMAKMSTPSVYTLIPAQLLESVHNSSPVPFWDFSAPLKVGSSGPDVVALQNVLKYEGMFPLGTASTGTYAKLTAAGVQAFQEAYSVADYNTLGALDGQSVGPLTIAKLNELYAGPFKPRIIAWANAAKTHEGYFAPGQNPACPNGSLSWKNNNPGNFKFANQPNAIDVGGWACFLSYAAGFDWLCEFLTICATITGPLYNPSMTLLQFYNVYSPDGTQAAYAAAVAAATGVSVDSPISVFIS